MQARVKKFYVVENLGNGGIGKVEVAVDKGQSYDPALQLARWEEGAYSFYIGGRRQDATLEDLRQFHEAIGQLVEHVEQLETMKVYSLKAKDPSWREGSLVHMQAFGNDFSEAAQHVLDVGFIEVQSE